jgi:HAD superfamily hydrolase (TIGR01509 family)
MAEQGNRGGITAVIFDMDGVLIDSEPVHQIATDEVARRYGLPPVTPEVFSRYFFGRTDYSGFLDYLTAVGRPDLSIPELIEANAEAYARRFTAEVEAFPDGLAALHAAFEHGYRLAIVSGARNSELDAVVTRFELAGLLETTVGGDDVPIGKPDPAPYLTGAHKLGLAPAQCLVIEDAPAGVASAKAAGMRCLAVDRVGWPDVLAEADRVVTRVTIEEIDQMAERDTP